MSHIVPGLTEIGEDISVILSRLDKTINKKEEYVGKYINRDIWSQ